MTRKELRLTVTVFAGMCIASLLALGEAGPIVDLDFNSLSNGVFQDASPSAIRAVNVGGELCAGVDGHGLRLPGGAKCVNLEWPEALRSLDALTLSVWVAPEAAEHQEILSAPAAEARFDGLPFMLRWRADWTFLFEAKMADGERRTLAARPGSVAKLSYPKRHWVHVAATFDGETSRLYLDGKPVASTTFPSGKKGIERIAGPVKIGGHGGFYKGAVDNLRVYDRALSADEIAALAGEQAKYVPAAMKKDIPGTLDGLPYVGASKRTHWLQAPLKRGSLLLSNTGEVKFWGTAGAVNQANQWDLSYPIGFPGQAQAGTNFYTQVDGNVEVRADGTTILELQGETRKGLDVRQRVEVTPADEVRFRYDVTARKPDAPSPSLAWWQYLWSSAMRFVGHDEQGLITGNLMDADGDLLLRGLNEFNLVASDNRLIVNLAPGTQWAIHGTRDPLRWRGGYTTLASELGVPGWRGWAGSPAVLEFSVQLESDDLPCRLDRKQAREVTRDVPFDFGGLYVRDPAKLDLHPSDRDNPIYLETEPVSLTLNIPAKTLPASSRATQWFHLAGTYNGTESRLYLNGKLWHVQNFGIDEKPLRLEGKGEVMIGGPQEAFSGAIDNVRIYRRALTEAEIKAHFDERADFKPGAAPEAVGAKGKPDDPALVLWLDFDKLEQGIFQDRSPLALKAHNNRGTLGEGVDGAALILSNSASVTVEMPPSARDYPALTVEAWVNPDSPQYSTIVGAVHHQDKYNGMPFSLRWRTDQSFWLFNNTPDGETRNTVGLAACRTLLFPQQYAWTLTNTLTLAELGKGEFRRDPASGQFERSLSLPALTAGTYRVDVEARTADGTAVDRCGTELAVAGEVAQPVIKPGATLNLKKVDEVDLTADKPGHDFHSFSGRSKVVREKAGSWRQTLSYKECQSFLSEIGASSGWWANDWFGVRFRTEPGRLYVVEMEYPDREFMSVSAYLMEPKDDPTDGKCKPVQRTSTGLFTGTFVPADGTMKAFQTVHFASAPWVAVCIQNGHSANSSGKTDLTPACVRKVVLYEVVGDLPKLDAPADGNRLLGVYCESGGLALCPFGPNSFRGELGNWNNPPKPEVYYREAYKTIENLIRYMRYRGDTTLFYGVYRYRSAMFPSRAFPPSHADTDVDLVALLARMFEKNGLKLVLNVMANNPLPTSRLHEHSRYDVLRGASGVTPVNRAGLQGLHHRSIPSSNPFHPKVREAYASLAADLGERYGKYPAVAGISWMTGQAWWEPCLPVYVPAGGTAEENERDLLGATCDDETMRQFAAWAKVTLPGKPDDPARFQQRFDWIMANAKDAFKDFRCWGMAQTHLAFQKAFAEKAPGKDYLALDYYQDIFVRKAEWAPLEACRLFGGGPRFYRDTPGLVYFPYVPEINGAVHWEHNQMSLDRMPWMAAFVQDEDLSGEWDALDRSARFIHRQFYEQHIRLRDEPDHKWFWAPEVSRLATISYPQQGGAAYRLDFLLALARGTPNYISYMWCDSTIPMGHEREHQAFAAAYRALPQGRYREADRQDQVFVRCDDTGKKVFYVVNASAVQADVEVKIGLAGTFADVVSGTELKAADGKAKIRLPPYALQVYRLK